MGSNNGFFQWLTNYHLRMLAVDSSAQALDVIKGKTLWCHGFEVFVFGVKKRHRLPDPIHDFAAPTLRPGWIST